MALIQSEPKGQPTMHHDVLTIDQRNIRGTDSNSLLRLRPGNGSLQQVPVDAGAGQGRQGNPAHRQGTAATKSNHVKRGGWRTDSTALSLPSPLTGGGPGACPE